MLGNGVIKKRSSSSFPLPPVRYYWQQGSSGGFRSAPSSSPTRSDCKQSALLPTTSQRSPRPRLLLACCCCVLPPSRPRGGLFSYFQEGFSCHARARAARAKLEFLEASSSGFCRHNNGVDATVARCWCTNDNSAQCHHQLVTRVGHSATHENLRLAREMQVCGLCHRGSRWFEPRM